MWLAQQTTEVTRPTHTQVRAGVFTLLISTRRSNELVNVLQTERECSCKSRRKRQETKQLNKRTLIGSQRTSQIFYEQPKSLKKRAACMIIIIAHL